MNGFVERSCMIMAVVCAVSGFMTEQALAAAHTVSVTCRFAAPDITSGGTKGYSSISIEGCSRYARVGAPQLPFRIVRLVLPPETDVAGVASVSGSNPVDLRGNWLLDFGLPPLSAGLLPSPMSAGPDPSIYQSSSPFPENKIEFVSAQRMAGYNIAILRVFPLQYYPATGRIVFTPVLSVEVTLKNRAGITSAGPQIEARPASRERAQVAAFVDNPPLLEAYPLQASPQIQILGGGDENPIPPFFKYLLVTSQSLMPAFQPLLDQRVADGFTVHAESMENIASNYSGRDLAEKLRNYVRYAYTNSGVEYVLLGGDAAIVPTRLAYGYCSGSYGSIPCDLYFACLDGSWNGNNNGVWGEVNDGDAGGDVDLLAEVTVGRAPVETQAEVENFVAKTLAAAGNMTGRIQACLAGEYLGYVGGVFAQGGNALDILLPGINYSHSGVIRLDDRPSNASVWSTADALRALNSSPLLVAHNGHADDATVMRMSVPDVASLTNARPFIFYSTGCDAGAFDNSMYPDCIGEELVKHNRYGAFAALVNTRKGWFDGQREWLYSGEYQKRFFDGLLTGGRSIVGKAHQLARQDMIGSVETTGDMPYRWCYFGLVLLGDPCASISVPVTVSVRADSGGNSLVLEWNSRSNSVYSVLLSADLQDSNAVCIASNIAAASPFNTLTNNLQTAPRGFYRVRESR